MRLFYLPLILMIAGCNDPNEKAEYGDSGLPKNCRAIVKANIEEYQKVKQEMHDTEMQLGARYGNDSYEYRGEAIDYHLIAEQKINDIFESLNRNCGEYGYSWGGNK
jgi:hypothetical protein